MRLNGSDRLPRQQALDRFQAVLEALPNLRSETRPRSPHGSLSAVKEAIRPIPGNTQSRSTSTIIRSMFVSFLAILTNTSRNGSEVVCCALMPKAV